MAVLIPEQIDPSTPERRVRDALTRLPQHSHVLHSVSVTTSS